MIKNPVSGKFIKINGSTYQKLIDAGYRNYNGMLKKIDSVLIFPEEIMDIVIQYINNHKIIINLLLLNSRYAEYICSRAFKLEKLFRKEIDDVSAYINLLTIKYPIGQLGRSLRERYKYPEPRNNYVINEYSSIRDIEIVALSKNLKHEKITSKNKQRAIQEISNFI